MGKARRNWQDADTETLLAELRRLEAGGQGGGSEWTALQDELVRRHAGLVRSVAAQFRFTGEPIEDLVQAGYLGLLGAVANFDLARGTKFSTYATHLIKGEIRHYIRDKYGSIRVPQWVRAVSQRVRECQDQLYQEKGRPPTLEEIAKALEVGTDTVAEALKSRDAMTYVSLDAERRATDPSPSLDLQRLLAADSAQLPLEVRLRIAAAVERLSDLQRKIIDGLFYQGRTQADVGEEVGLPQRQVARMKERVLKEMSEQLFGHSDGLQGRRTRNKRDEPDEGGQ
ncbi:MAG: sigma-70 family RNA polymerase sigma factor [Candidatus Bipolaricaulota bacterium]